ncbi:MAG: alpha/beta hydrolase [Acidobacteria bacterium]|nr:alpha/beta hydrolase [Acidobacteriota bacterium]
MMSVDRRKFCQLAAVVLTGCGVRPDQTAESEPASTIGAARSLGGFPDSDFYGVAAEFDEVEEAQARLSGNDLESYLKAWNGMAAEAERQADALLAEGRRVSAHEAYLRASNYYNRAQQGLLRVGDGVRILEPYQKMRDNWAKAWTLKEQPFEWMQIPFRDTTLPGFFVRADPCSSDPRPVVLECSGSDHILERNFFRSKWKPFVNRGFSYLAIDGLGQGEPLRLRQMYLEPDAEDLISALDYLETRPDVDMGRIGLFGTAFGGYAAARAAIDPRVRAVACRSVSFDLWRDCYEYCPAFRSHLEYMLGVSGEDEARRALAPFTLEKIAEKIQAPIAIYHGGRDDVQDPRGAQRLYEAIPGEQKTLKILPDRGHGVGRQAALEITDWLVASVA